MDNKLKIGGHRGYIDDNYIENTILAMQHAFDIGMDYVEIDLQYTTDGEIVIIHDDIISDAENSYQVTDLSYSELLKINPDIPTLEMVLGEFKDTELGFLLEVKSCVNTLGDRLAEYMTKLFDLLKDYKKDKICVFSIDYDFLHEFNKIDKEHTINKGIIVTESLKDPIAFMEEHKVQLYLAMLRNLDKEIVSKLKRSDYLVSASVINTIEEKEIAEQLGVDMFETDNYKIVKYR